MNTVTWDFPVTVCLVAEAWGNFGRAFCARGEWRCRPGTFSTVPSRRTTAGAASTGRQNTASSPADGAFPPAVTVIP